MTPCKFWLLLIAVVLFGAIVVFADGADDSSSAGNDDNSTIVAEDDADDCGDAGSCDDVVTFIQTVGPDPDTDRRRRSAGYGNLESYGRNFDGYGRYGGYGKAYVSKPTYASSFREGKWKMDNEHMVKNYYKKGTYETAKRYFIALPFVKIVPVTTTTSIDYVGQLRAYSGSHGGYTVRLCENCHKGSSQIEFRSKGKPYHNVVRRFNFLPHTKRSRTVYGKPRIVPGGKAYVSHRDNYGDTRW